jgi:hypothetical protein
LEISGNFSASILVQGRSTATGVLFDIPVIRQDGELISSITFPGIYIIPKVCNFLRIGLSAYTSGIVNGILSRYTFGNSLYQFPLKSRKLSISGFNSIAALNNNLLDNSGNGLSTDVRDYQSGKLYIFSTATSGNYLVQGAFDFGFSIGSHAIQLFESIVQNQNPIVTPISLTSSTRIFDINLQGINFLRVILNSAIAGVRAFIVLSPAAFVPSQTNIQQATAANLNAVVSQSIAANLNAVVSQTSAGNLQSLVSLAIPSLISDIPSSAITATVSTAITPTLGSNYIVSCFVTVVSGTSPSLILRVEESDDSGTNWFTVYIFPVITAVGNYRSPRLKLMGNRIRYVQTVAGTTPSFTRSISRMQLHTDSDNFRQTVPTTTNGSIGVANTAQVAIAPNGNRAFLYVQNNSVNDMWINFSGTAAINAGIKLVAGASERFENRLCPIGAVSIFGAILGQTYTCLLYTSDAADD